MPALMLTLAVLATWPLICTAASVFRLTVV